MPNPILPRRSFTPLAVPIVSTDISAPGELVINWADGKAFTKDASGNLITITLGGGGSGSGLSWSTVPTLPNSAGAAGSIAYDSNYLYAAVSSGSWRRSAWQAWDVPTSIAGLQAWYDAADSSTLYDATSGGSLVAADGAVARWEDKSGNSRHATQATSGNRPVRKTSVQGGRDALRFDVSSQHSLTAGTTSTWKFLHDGTASYAMVVLKPGATSDPNALMAILDTGGVSGEQVGFFLAHDDRAAASQNNSVFVSVSANNNAGYQSFARDSEKLPSNAYSLLEVLVSPSAATASRLRSRVNGGAQFGTNVDTLSPSNASSTNALYIGKTDLGTSFGFGGDICEILLYSQQPTTSDQAALRSYLAAKWGITIT